MKTRPLVIRGLILLVVLGPAAGVGYWWRSHVAGQMATYTIAAGDVISGLTVSGVVRSRNRAAIAAEIMAVVSEVLVAEGQTVQGGQVLLKLDDSVAAAECAMAAARRDLAKHQLAELKAGARKQELDKARQELNRAEANLKYARQQLEKVKQAVEGGAGTASELDLANNRVDQAQAETGYANAQLAVLEAGARPEAVARAQADQRLAEADVDRLEALRRRHVLRAPHAGVVTVKDVHVGDVVAPGQVLLRVDDVKDLEIRAAVQEGQLARVKIGCTARVLADAYPDRPVKATAREILPRVDPERGTVTVLLDLAEASAATLMDGMAVDIAVIQDERKGVIRVPAEALSDSGKQRFVQVRQGGSFVRRAVVTGLSDGQWVEITSGLSAGETVRLP